MNDQNIRSGLRSQHLAALQMMQDFVEACPDSLWTSDKFINPSWKVAYHALFFYRLYLFQTLEDHRHWSGHRSAAQNMNKDPDYKEVEPYTRREIQEFIQHCRELTESQISTLNIEAESCGFPWYEASKFEHLVVNVRHMQQHVGQLQDRLRNEHDVGITWTKIG